MKKKYQLILFLVTLFLASCSNNDNNSKIKSIVGYSNDTIRSIQTFDVFGRVKFTKTTQVIGDWNNDLMTFMTAYDYDNNNKLKNKYYAHSNSGFRVYKYLNDINRTMNNEYCYEFDELKNNKRNQFASIYYIKSADSLISYLNNLLPPNSTFQRYNRPKIESTEYFSIHKDTSNNTTHEFWTIEDSVRTKSRIEKLDKNDNLILRVDKYHHSTQGITTSKFNSNGKLIETLKGHGKSKTKTIYNYKKSLLTEKLVYHGNDLAFKNEYIYSDTLLEMVISNRLTNNPHFENRKRCDTIIYQYEFY